MSQQTIEPPAWILIPDAAYRPKPLPKRILHMYYLHGTTEGKTCRQCAHLFDNNAGNRHHYYKCQWHHVTAGPATDWRTSWPACGKFQEQDPCPPSA